MNNSHNFQSSAKATQLSTMLKILKIPSRVEDPAKLLTIVISFLRALFLRLVVVVWWDIENVRSFQEVGRRGGK